MTQFRTNRNETSDNCGIHNNNDDVLMSTTVASVNTHELFALKFDIHNNTDNLMKYKLNQHKDKYLLINAIVNTLYKTDCEIDDN